MGNKVIHGVLLAAVVAAGMMAGCDSASLKAETHKMSASQEKDFDRQRMDIMFQVAQQQYQVGDYDKCRESLKAALASPTPYAPMHVLAARVEMEGGNLEVAASELKKALSIDATQAEPLYLLGVVYQRWQKYDTACDYYQQACDKTPGEALYVLAVAEMRITLGQLDQAKQLLQDKLVYFEQSAAMRIALARIAELQGDKVEAARMYRDATMLLPEDKNLRWTYAMSLYDTAKYSDAARILEDLRRDPPTLPKAPGAQARGDGSQPADAGDAATDAEAALDTKVSLLMTLGECYISLKRPMDARDCFQQIVEAQPDNVSAYLSLGKTCLMTDDLGTTTAAAQKALRFEPDNVQAMLLQAAVQQKQEKWTESLETLSHAAHLAPQNLTVLCMLGISQLELGQKEAAAGSFERAVALKPGDAWATELLGRVKPAAVPALKATPAPALEGDELSPAATNIPQHLPELAPAVTNALPAGADGQ